MLQNGQEMAGVRQHSSGIRSQDDATVGYFFQRPQPDMSQQYNSKRWAVGDDSVIEQARGVHEMDRQFQHLGFEPREIAPNAKKIWDDDVKEKSMFHAGANNPWSAAREDAWGNNQAPAGEHPQQAGRFPPEGHMSHMMMRGRPGSLPGADPGSVLSPRSSETGALGVNMAEYVLGGSPVGKDFDPRFRAKAFPSGSPMYVRAPMQEMVPGPVNTHAGGEPGEIKVVDKSQKAASPFEGEVKQEEHMKENVQANGMLQNGPSEQRGSRQSSPAEEGGVPGGVMPGMVPNMRPEDMLEQQMQPQQVQAALALDNTMPFGEPVAIDPMGSFDYANQLSMPSMDSPNFNMDYSQQLMQQQRQQPIAVLTQQQYALAAQQQQQQQQQLGLAPNNQGFAPAPYIVNATQDPYTVGIPIAGPATVVPQYYQVQTPWGIYPAGLLQQGAGSQPQAAGQAPQQQQPQPAPQQQLLGAQRQARPLTPQQQGTPEQGLGTPTGGLQPQPAPLQAPGGAQYQILAPAYYDQNGQLVMGGGRGLGTPVRLVPPGPILVNAAAGQQGNNTNGALPANTLRLLTTQQQGQPVQGQQTPVQQQPMPQQAYSSAGSTPHTPGAMQEGYPGNTGNLYTPVSNSLFTPISSTLQPTYNSNGLGQLGTPATPGAIGSGLGSGNRLYSAAPGAENKYRSNGSLTSSSGLFSSSLFPSTRILPKSSTSLTKEVTGRSRLLEDFRNNRIPNLQLKDLVNHVVEFSQDQHGSRFIQQKLERATAAEKAMVFNEILTAAYSLMTDVFGNYVIQKFFEFGSPDQKQTLAQRVRGHVLPLALQMYGCRVIQKALESIPPDMQVEIVKELDGHVLKCVKDQNGNHVVQKCIECVDPKHLQFLIDAFKGQVFALSTHPYGCRVIQRILEHCTPKQTGPILEELHCQTERLVQDQYGNYVIQHVLEHGHPEDKCKIVSELNGKILALSQHKFASNVVEKCVSHSCPAERAMLIDEVCSINDGPHSALYSMMKDQFANYVVQKMIDVAEPAQRKLLMQKIRPHVPTLRKYTYGKHILAKLEKYYMKTAADLGPIGMPPHPNGNLP